MRSALVVLGVVAGVAAADPIRDDILDKRVREKDAAVRAEAAKALAERARAGRGVATTFAKRRVMTNDSDVRVAMLDVLIELKIIPAAAAAFVPTERVMTQMIRKLLPKEKAAALPPEEWCQVEGGDARSVTIICPVNRCIGDVHERRNYTFTTGVRWKVSADQRIAADDGTCGDERLIE
jgi:hypothetical protein